jgi:hypothetical protein
VYFLYARIAPFSLSLLIEKKLSPVHPLPLIIKYKMSLLFIDSP